MTEQRDRAAATQDARIWTASILTMIQQAPAHSGYGAPQVGPAATVRDGIRGSRRLRLRPWTSRRQHERSMDAHWQGMPAAGVHREWRPALGADDA